MESDAINIMRCKRDIPEIAEIHDSLFLWDSIGTLSLILDGCLLYMSNGIQDGSYCRARIIFYCTIFTVKARHIQYMKVTSARLESIPTLSLSFLHFFFSILAIKTIQTIQKIKVHSQKIHMKMQEER